MAFGVRGDNKKCRQDCLVCWCLPYSLYPADRPCAFARIQYQCFRAFGQKDLQLFISQPVPVVGHMLITELRSCFLLKCYCLRTNRVKDTYAHF